MKFDRRKFLNILGGTAAAGVGSKLVYEAVAKDELVESAGKHTTQRWAMAIDIGKFTQQDMDDAINACHVIHNVPKIDEKKHEVKWIWKENFEHAFINKENHFIPKEIREMDVLLLCNHCDNPPCTRVCPTQATWKREKDGIVMMDWHRCIGCRYCIAACPYGSRSFNFVDPKPLMDNMTEKYPARSKGVVEKCTFCSEYIVNGEYIKPPACVAATRDGLMYFGDLNDKNSDVYRVLTKRYSIRRKPELATQPEVYYLIDEEA